MTLSHVRTAAVLIACIARAAAAQIAPDPMHATPVMPTPGEEKHLANIRQITHGGDNAEAYFSASGKQLTFQSTRNGRACDQQYTMNVDGTNVKRISNGQGKTTCGYFFANDKKIFYASTFAVDTACPAKLDPSKGYVWGLDPFDIYTANADGSGLKALTQNHVYTAEGTLSPDGRSIVFTSLKDGDLEIYTMDVDGKNVRRLTLTPGYDGGAFFSPDSKKIVYRANHPTDSALKDYQALLAQRIVRPTHMEIWVMNADGSDQHQVTNLGGANFAPFFTPDGKKIIFSSNYKKPHSSDFNLYLVDLDGKNLEQITFDPGFDGFPQFSPDGKQLVWVAHRNAAGEREVNIFIADWKN
jgi:Tol biopolymer transport system component